MKKRFSIGIVLIVLLCAVVISSISISIALSDKMKATGDAVSRLRQFMKGTELGFEPLFAYIVPSDDSHQSEYIAQRDRRRQFITKFTGSAGTAVVTQTEALVWTDGRYFQQAEKQLDNSTWTLMKVPTTPFIKEVN